MARQKLLREDHPANVLGLALSRASGVLRSLTTCHDPVQGGFVVSEQFIAQAVAAIEIFITDACGAFDELCMRCDLNLNAEAAAHPTAAPASASPAAAAPTEPEAPVAFPFRLRDPEVFAEPAQAAAALPTGLDQDGFAASYDDLLRKLTAAEVFAAERVHQGDPGPLLPLLKSLRQDLGKLRVA